MLFQKNLKFGDLCLFFLTKLTSLVVPSTVSDIGERSFDNCGFKYIQQGTSKVSDTLVFAQNTKMYSLVIPNQTFAIKLTKRPKRM